MQTNVKRASSWVKAMNASFVDWELCTTSPKMSYIEACRKYRAGEYCFKAPPVCTAAWTEEAWIMFLFGIAKPV